MWKARKRKAKPDRAPIAAQARPSRFCHPLILPQFIRPVPRPSFGLAGLTTRCASIAPPRQGRHPILSLFKFPFD
ncbi:MAG: hypothetical protein P8I95_07510 [Alphaproteobacteria bacterium]|nr:hypothetical protein [Alphaproteobacteria bacterium]